MNSSVGSLISVVAAVAIGALVAVAGSDGGATAAGVPVMIWCTIAAYGVNWIAYMPSVLQRSERFFDLTGTLTYLTVLVLGLVLVGRYDTRALLLAGAISVWSLRLGIFLAHRIAAAGSDRRFDALKTNPLRLLSTWTLQGLWVLLAMAAALAAITAATDSPIGWTVPVGGVLWAVGFGIEVTADNQKRLFRADAENDGDFITTGLWAWSRHPNYFGEVTLWSGVALMSLGALGGWSYLTLVSPVFVYLLLTRVSGIPLLEHSGMKRWGADPRYRAYVERTPSLFPRPPRQAEAPVP